MFEILPTNTCPPTYEELARRSEEFALFAPAVQLDIADGIFVTARSWPYSGGRIDAVEALPGTPKLSYEVHLMVQEPRDIGERLARAGASRVMAHIEVFKDADAAREALDAWRAAGAREVGLAMLMQTPIAALEGAAGACDFVQLMSIGKLGYQGAPFEEGIYDRIREVRARFPQLAIEIDGGVSDANIQELARAGATRFGVGSAISKAPDMKFSYDRLLQLVQSAT